MAKLRGSQISNLVGNINLQKSYPSLVYGIFTMVILAVLIAVGIRFFSGQQEKGSITKEGARTEQSKEKKKEQTYKVVKGDTLWSISEKFYKSGYNWVDISHANKIVNPNIIGVGKLLTIPDVVPKTPIVALSAESTERVEGIKGNTYTVEREDYLWQIAVRAYGDGFRWVEIARANKLKNPDLIHPGNKFALPR